MGSCSTRRGACIKGKSSEDQIKNAATYLHYLLLARPDSSSPKACLPPHPRSCFLGIGSVGIRQLTVEWSDENLYKFLYVFIYRLYHPSHLADPSYTRIKLNKETSEVTYTVQFKLKEYGLCTIHARNPFMTRIHVLSNPSPPTKEGDEFPTILKEQLCQTGRHFNEQTILTRIHRPTIVPGVVEAVDFEIIPAPLSPKRQNHRLGLRQTGLPFTSIRTAKEVLVTLFDPLEGI